MISKELLSEVLNEVCPIVEIKKFKNNNLLIKYQNQYQKTINIYELAHMCKEWALKNGYKLHDYAHSIVIVNLNMNIEYSVIDDNFNNVYDVERFFKACEWILENK